MNNLVAGRELDTLVAAQVMGEPCPPPVLGDDQWSEVFSRNHDGQLYLSPHGAWYAVCEYDQNDEVVWYPRPYSTSIAAAWEVVEKLASIGEGMDIGVSIKPTAYRITMWNDDGDQVVTCADTAPLAICLAALKVAGHE